MPFFNKKKNNKKKPNKSAGENNKAKGGFSLKPPKLSLKVLKEAGQETLTDMAGLLPDVRKTAGSAANTAYKGAQAAAKTGASGFTHLASFASSRLGNEEKAENLMNLTNSLQTSAYNNLDEASESLVQAGQHAINSGAKLINQDPVYADNQIDNTGGMVHLIDQDFERNDESNIELNNIANNTIDKGVQYVAKQTGLDDGIEYNSPAYKVVENVLGVSDKIDEGLTVSQEYLQNKGLGVINSVTENMVDNLFINPAASINESIDNKDYIGSIKELTENANINSITSKSLNGATTGITEDLLKSGLITVEEKEKLDARMNLAIEGAIIYDQIKGNSNKEKNSKLQPKKNQKTSQSAIKAKESGLPEAPEGYFYNSSTNGKLFIQRKQRHDYKGKEIPPLKIDGKRLINVKTNKYYQEDNISGSKTLTLASKFALQNLINPKDSSGHEGLSLFEKIDKEDTLLDEGKNFISLMKTLKEMKDK